MGSHTRTSFSTAWYMHCILNRITSYVLGDLSQGGSVCNLKLNPVKKKNKENAHYVQVCVTQGYIIEALKFLACATRCKEILVQNLADSKAFTFFFFFNRRFFITKQYKTKNKEYWKFLTLDLLEQFFSQLL